MSIYTIKVICLLLLVGISFFCYVCVDFKNGFLDMGFVDWFNK